MKNPTLCVCCPECKSCFMALTMESDTMDSNLWAEICGYVRHGSIIEVRESRDINFNYCEHLKIKNEKIKI